MRAAGDCRSFSCPGDGVRRFFYLRQHRRQFGFLFRAEHRHDFLVHRLRGWQDLAIEIATRTAQQQMMGSAIGAIRTAIQQRAIDEIFHRPIDGHLVHQCRFHQMPLRRGTARTEYGHDSPFRYLETEAALILARDKVADGVGRR